jgi:hypothetical protein
MRISEHEHLGHLTSAKALEAKRNGNKMHIAERYALDLADAQEHIAELQADAERLNAIESKYLCVSWISMTGKWDVLTNEAHPAHRKNYQRKELRAAIDAAIAAQRQKAGE